MTNKPSTEERLENSIKNQPGRYIPERDTKGRLVSVADRDSGFLWVRFKDKKTDEDRWGWIA